MNEIIKEKIQKAAEVLKSFGATEVYVFGSVATDTYNEDSDIDLAVSGIPPKKFFAAMGSVFSALQSEVDLIDLDEKSLFSEHLKNHGELKRVA